ncbi:potassium channel family protein [Egbenema bharatensis]|uniref:potassium channel family protein n=1 Tax=Egbenema bharatensis TaxID=3463334 RepID=UPI003A839E82
METGATPTDFITALYYSGFSLSTLGTGDIVPQTGVYRLLMILQAILGFSVVTMTLTFFMSVYSQLIQRNSFASSLHYRTAATADATELLIGLSSGGQFGSSAEQTISNTAQQVLTLIEAQHNYAALGYFRFQESHYALGRILFLVMDTATLIHSALARKLRFLRPFCIRQGTSNGRKTMYFRSGVLVRT